MLTFIKDVSNRCRTTAAIIVCCLLALQSVGQKNCSDCGVISWQHRIFKPELNAYVIPQYEQDEKRLFFDSMVIMERHRIVINEDAKGKEEVKVNIIGYTFANYRKKTFTNYTSFSDTARKLYIGDEGFGDLGDAASRFFKTNAKHYRHFLLIPDTIINGNRCSRMLSFTIEHGDTTVVDTIYYVPEAQSPLAYMNKILLNNKRYSVIRMDYYHIAKKIKGYSSVNVVASNLSKEEMQVFEVWRKNEAKVKQKNWRVSKSKI